MVIYTERLKLADLTIADLRDINHLHSNEKVAKYNTIGIPEDIEVTRKILEPLLKPEDDENKTDFSWTIRKSDTDEFLGEIGYALAPERYKLATLHYSLLPNYWGHGFATEAAFAIINHCFEDLNLHRLEAGCAVDNLASIRVLEKLGMQREGRKRKVLPLKKGWSDNFEFALLEEDFIHWDSKTPLVIKQYFRASTLEVWEALTDQSQMIQWYFDAIPAFEPIPGFSTSFNVLSNGREFQHLWKVTEVEPLKKIGYSWKYGNYPGYGHVKFEMSGAGKNTMLQLTATGFESFPGNIIEFRRESCESGWRYFIEQSLKDFLENRKNVPES